MLELTRRAVRDSMQAFGGGGVVTAHLAASIVLLHICIIFQLLRAYEVIIITLIIPLVIIMNE